MRARALLWLAAATLTLALSSCSLFRDLDELSSEHGAVDVDWWVPKPGTSWQYQLSDPIDVTVDVSMYGVDLFAVTDDELATLKADGRVVICYFSAGTWEPFRDDSGDFTEDDKGKPLADYPEERWLDPRSDNVGTIMRRRIERAAARGCDGIVPANVDAFFHDHGFQELLADDQLAYSRMLAAEGHARGLSVGLQHAIGMFENLAQHFDWVLEADCVDSNTCSLLASAIRMNKAVFHLAHVDDVSQVEAARAKVCGAAATAGFSTLIKLPELGAWYATCGSEASAGP